TSDNISPLHLINLKRVAYGVREVAAPAPPAAAKTVRASVMAAPARPVIEKLVDQWLGGRPSSPASVPVAPPLESFRDLEPGKNTPPVGGQVSQSPQAVAPAKPVGFVCEDDVRNAIQSHSRIVVNKKTIITPSARELAEAHEIFIME